MATKILLPRLGESVEEAAIGRWVKSVGDPVKRGDVIAELETAKAMMELESPVNGVLLAVFSELGKTIQMGELVAVVGKEGEDWQTVLSDQEPVTAPDVVAEQSPSVQPTRAGRKDVDRLRISPNAKRVARENEIDISALSPKDGGERITAEDVLQLVKREPASTPSGIPFIELKPNRIEQITAERVAASTAAMPQFSISMEVEAERIIKNIKKHKTDPKVRVTITAYLVKVAAATLKDFPRLNARFAGEIIECFQHANIAVAVATRHGLYVPVIHQADQLTLVDITKKIKKLADKCKDRSVRPDALSGGTFTVSNLGMKGVRQFVPIIDPSQSAILGVGEVFDAFKIKKNGNIKRRRKMILTLVCDHRVVDGAGAADFLDALRKRIETEDMS